MGWIFDDVLGFFPDGAVTPVCVGVASIISLNVIVRAAKSFKRDARGDSFGNIITGSVSILSNKDSVLKREQVNESMDGYDKLFDGARKNVGSLHQEESIRTREKEYNKTMINNFYDLVTDFYEYGWGQVSFGGH
jgi:sterol 24-C-methyltransferase